VLPFAVATALIVGLVLFVENNNSDTPANVNQAAEVQANREAEILVAQDQAPHTARLGPANEPAPALKRAIDADMTSLIAHGALNGPLQHSSCKLTGSGASARLRYKCTATADGLAYPFYGVVDVSDRTITYCKRDPPPARLENIPISRRCTA
jgi:hypothetical protein